MPRGTCPLGARCSARGARGHVVPAPGGGAASGAFFQNAEPPARSGGGAGGRGRVSLGLSPQARPPHVLCSWLAGVAIPWDRATAPSHRWSGLHPRGSGEESEDSTRVLRATLCGSRGVGALGHLLRGDPEGVGGSLRVPDVSACRGTRGARATAPTLPQGQSRGCSSGIRGDSPIGGPGRLRGEGAPGLREWAGGALAAPQSPRQEAREEFPWEFHPRGPGRGLLGFPELGGPALPARERGG